MLRDKLKRIIACALIGLVAGTSLFIGKRCAETPEPYHTVPMEQHVEIDYSETVLSELSSINKLEIYQCYLKNDVTIHKGFNNKFFKNNKGIEMYATGIYKLDLSNIDQDLMIHGDNVVVMASIEHDVIVHEDKFKFTDDKGWLAFYDVEVSPEEMTKIVQETKDQMSSKMLSEEFLGTVKEKAAYIIVDRLKDINPDFNVRVLWR